MENKKCPIWAQAREKLTRLRQVLVLYLDDLLLIGSGCCFVAAAWDGVGRPAALAVAGTCLCIYALVIARGRRGGGC